MLFVDGKGSTMGTKLTGIISSLGERYVLNDGIWTPTDDLKIAWCYFSGASTGCTYSAGDGVYALERQDTGIYHVTYSGTYDAVPACFAIPIAASSTNTDRYYGVISDGVAANRYRTTSKQTVIIFDDDASTIITDTTAVGIFFLAIGVDSHTTDITDNSDNTPLTANSLNRIYAIGNYRNPSVLDDMIFVLSCGYTSTGAGAGDTLVDISNCASQSGADGSYTTTWTTSYNQSPMPVMVSIIGDDTTCGYGVSQATLTTATVQTTNGTDNNNVARNYCFLTIGEMEVS